MELQFGLGMELRSGRLGLAHVPMSREFIRQFLFDVVVF